MDYWCNTLLLSNHLSLIEYRRIPPEELSSFLWPAVVNTGRGTVLIFPTIYQINSRTLWSPSYKGFERSLLSYKGWQGEEAILLQQIPQSSHRSTNPSLHFLAPQQLTVEDWSDRLWDPTGIQYRKKSEETDNCRCTNNTSWDLPLPVTIHSGPTLPHPILPPWGYLQK